MLLRTLLVLVLGLTVASQAAPKKTGKAGKSTSRSKKSKKPRKVANRDKVREQSIAAWPRLTEIDGRLAKVGVPELDRLLVDRPPLGSPIAEDPASDVDIDSKGRMAVDERERGVASVAFASPDMDPLERLKVVAEPFLGTPYRTGGESTKGFDCSGFVRAMLKAFGQNLNGRSSGEYYKQGEPVDKDHLQTGDLLFFADHHRSIGHVGIYLAEGKFVHASVQLGVIVSGLDEKYYKGKYKAARRHESFASALRSENPPDISTP